MKILVVDDDPLIRTIVTAGLKAGGHEVLACASGEEGWDAVRRTPCPVVITDWSMPGMDGLQLTQLIRRLPRNSYTYVIMLTAKAKRDDYLMGVQAGVDAFLGKPLDGAMLEAQIRIAARILGLDAHARQLEAVVTVCSLCKRVKHKGTWVPLQQYVADTSASRPSVTFCPTCLTNDVEPVMRQFGIPTDSLPRG